MALCEVGHVSLGTVATFLESQVPPRYFEAGAELHEAFDALVVGESFGQDFADVVLCLSEDGSNCAYPALSEPCDSV